MSTVAYEIVDVFTDRPFSGNPLAVVSGADHLATDQLQTLAREFNLSETTFVLPPTSAEATYRVRIFTTDEELPFAGHPSVGTAVTLMRQGHFGPGRVVQECGAGLLPIEVTAAGAATLTGAAPRLGVPVPVEALLEISGLTAEDHACSGSAVAREAGCGLDWTFLPVRRSALARVVIDARAAARHGVTDLGIFAWDPESATAHARMFVAGSTVWEDAATGSAALGLGVWLVGAGWLPADGLSTYHVSQGSEMKRPSRLDCTVTAVGGAATSATVTGHVVPVATGRIAVPPFIG
ncbi:phenazine biosynthesis protein PhzF [Actinoplanes sp. SE50]|uniref:PhzF family phenazine biosynthesis protein n=1 Tax=unclassified Actinoplanes TaxID=2626549 RepID=UPI00023EDE5F|nr:MULTISPECIES: PhzF family phenazine biosynthesis protein [unclassified Actinoplanes]AEV88716.1 putative epimerase [Actinoplanes sp. SE50/110]ATO87120.1 phenazine biosynthesis protein PhzF [Actinoplanes sp. SE50]SLM04538.1 phenazine biosynthesis protein PhzF [Actinoplanes sp. SE50/110]